MESKSLRNQINYLEKKVSHLLEFEFEEKLRKLLKNLLEYIFDKYFDDYMEFNEKENKILFIRTPIHIEGKSDKTIKDILNKMLRNLFYETKEVYQSYNFMDQSENSFNGFSNKEKLFKNSKDLFIYFGLSQYENILNKIIPEKLLTTINFFNFESKINNKISKYINNKNKKY